MSQTFDFYDARAREAAIAAEQADLIMVRKRELRSATVWRELANQAARVDANRAEADSVRAARHAAEAAEKLARGQQPEAQAKPA